MFDSLDIRAQPVATVGAAGNVTTTANTSASGAGGVFGDLADLFGSSNNSTSGLVSQPPQPVPQQPIPQDVCLTC